MGDSELPRVARDLSDRGNRDIAQLFETGEIDEERVWMAVEVGEQVFVPRRPAVGCDDDDLCAAEIVWPIEGRGKLT